MVQFWAHKEVIFVHYCVLQFAYCAVFVAEDFDAVEVCCKTGVTCVELEVCNCLFSGFVFCCFPHEVLMFCHCVLCFLFYGSLNCFKDKWCLFVLKCCSFFFQ